MKAIMMTGYGGPDRLEFTDAPDPDEKPGWTTVELRAAALNRHDVLVREGVYGSPTPHVLGADGAGVRVGDSAEVMILPSLFWGDRTSAPGREFDILGDHVPGTYAQYVRVPDECVWTKPEGFTWEQAAAFPLVGVTAYRALATRAALGAGESLLILGAAGGIATMAAAVGRALGARVFHTASTGDKLAHAIAAGAEGGVLHSDPGWPEQARRLSPGEQGFDVILDPTGRWDHSIGALAPGGRLIVMGATTTDQAGLAVRPFYFGQFSLLGTTMGGPRDFEGVLGLVADGLLSAPPVAAVYPLAEAAEAHRRLEAGNLFGKVVLTI